MKIKLDEVDYIAKLAKLKFTEEETERLAKEFDQILTHFDNISSESLDGIELGIKQTGESVLRKDEMKVFEDKKALFQNVKVKRDSYIEIPKILD